MEMTLYEYRELLNSVNANFIDGFQFYVSLISAYLLAAYFVGKRLTRFQALAMSVLYAFAASGSAVYTAYMNYQAAVLAAEMFATYGVALAGVTDAAGSASGAIINGALFHAGIILSLVFMWSNRRTKTR